MRKDIVSWQVCSLELAKELDGLGVGQDSLFRWHSKIDSNGNRVHTELVYLPSPQLKQDFSAFTVAELGELLPRYSISLSWKQTGEFRINYTTIRGIPLHFEEDTIEANARAKMLIYLIKEGLVKV